MKHKCLAAALFLCTFFISAALAADGDILEREMIHTTESVVVERVIYESDGLRILGYLAYPANAIEDDAGAQLPCLMFNRGGNRDFGAMTAERATRIGTSIAGWGYVFFASNYRGSTGSEGKDEFGGDDVHDVVNAIKIFDQLDFADGSRIGMWGHSRGGLMTYLALMQTNRVRAAVASGAATDMRAGIERRPEMDMQVMAEMVPNWAENRDAEIERRSPVRRVDELPKNVPIFIAHGLSDWRVDPREAIEMAGALLDAEVPFRMKLYEGADHGLKEHREEFHADIRAWFNHYVRDEAPLPDVEPHGD